MSLIVPFIIYPPAITAPPGTLLVFNLPPRFVPYKSYQVTRHDNVSSAGVRETVYERTDEFLEFTMEYVKIGADIQAWDAFIQYALQGGPFNFFPDSTIFVWTTYTLEDTTWQAAYKSLGMFTFKVRMRRWVGWP